jgi:hypothetical protein
MCVHLYAAERVTKLAKGIIGPALLGIEFDTWKSGEQHAFNSW